MTGVNVKVGEDCAIGAVTVKELKGLPGCGCGDCDSGSVFGREGMVAIRRPVENENLVEEEGQRDEVCGSAMKGSGHDGFGVDHKEVVENGRDHFEGCIVEEAEVGKGESGELENGRNGVIEGGHCSADGRVEEDKVAVIEDCAIGAVTMKELKGLSDCCCGDCSGAAGFGGKASTVIVQAGNLSGEGGKTNRGRGVVVKGNGEDGFGADQEEEVFQNRRVKGEDRTGNCIGDEAEIKVRENGVLENGGWGLNIKVDLAEREHGDKSVPRTSDEMGTGLVADNNTENGDHNADGRLKKNKDEICEDSSRYANGKIGKDCAIGFVTIKELKGMPDCCCGDCCGIEGFNGKGSVVTVEGDDRIRNWTGEEAKVKLRENMALKNGDRIDADNVQEDSVNAASVAAKEELVPVEVEREDFLKDEAANSNPAKVITETRQENIEAGTCFGSFGQRELSGVPPEDVTDKIEDQHTVPEPEAEHSPPRAEVVDTTPQTDVVVADAPAAASPKGQAQASKVEKKLFNFMIKIPRYEDDHLKSKINDAQIEVDEMTRRRDAVKVEMHGKRAIHKESSEKFGAAVTEEKAARELLKSKRQDIDSVQNEINEVKNAMSLGDIDSEIRGMERRIQHETLPLKEERELINKIRKLKQLRGKMSSSIMGQDELKAALNNREQTEERLKNLKIDADSLRENCLRAEAVTKATKRIYHDVGEKLHELQARFKEANEIRQDAYVRLQSLKKELYEKNKPYWKYRNDAKMATDLAMKSDRDSLSQFCVEHVETFMETWNKSDEFRKEYLKSNARRTLRRLGTADGRSLGPNEEAPSLPPIVNERPAPEKSFPLLPSPKQEAVVQYFRVGSASDNVLTKDPGTKKQKPKGKVAVSAPTRLMASLVIVERDEVVEKKEPELTEEEQEAARKAEELRKEEEAEKLLEQRRLEEKAKAKEALERKKRNAERAEARAARNAQKEAEQKEKEREKRIKKKERKKLAGNASSDDIPDGESHAFPSETAVEAAAMEPEVRVKPMPTRRPSKPLHFAKQTKIAPIPAPLRHRGKRKMQTWMRAALAAVLVSVLFLVGNIWNLI